ncbi:MAG: hypothetical protein ACKOCO_16045 [Bacteroidota bacterium]
MPFTNIYLIKDEHFDGSLLTKTLELLRSVPGPVRFSVIPDMLVTGVVSDTASPAEIRLRLLQSIKNYREMNKTPEEDSLVLLSGLTDDFYWFNSKFVDGNDGIVHAGDWERYFSVPTDPVYPVVYEITAWVLRSRLFDNISEAALHAHRSPRGCFMDLCTNDSDVTLKMRTGDICPDCLEYIREKRLSNVIVSQIFQLWNVVSSKLSYRNTAGFHEEIVPLEINFAKKELCLTGYDAVIELAPIQMSVYAFFLKHSKTGVALRDLTAELLCRELLPLYLKLFKGSISDEARATVESLADPASNSLSEVISKIRRKFLDSLGSETLASHYTINKGAKENHHRIRLPEQLVRWVDSNGFGTPAPWEQSSKDGR